MAMDICMRDDFPIDLPFMSRMVSVILRDSPQVDCGLWRNMIDMVSWA